MPWMNPDYLDQLEPAKQQRLLATHLALGTNPNTGDIFFVPDADLYGGSRIIGLQGYGKSRLQEGMIHDDIGLGRAVIVFDAHGDMADHCLAALPVEAVYRTHVLDLADEDHPFGANLFAQGTLDTEVARTQAVERIHHIFKIFWPEVMNQQYAPQYLEYGARVMLDNPGTTLVDLRRFLRKAAYRAQLLRNVREPSVRDFWQREYNSLKPDTQESRSRPLINRLHLLTASPLLRNIICQPAAIDFRAAIERHEVLIFKLPTTTMEHDAGMVGTILMGQISAAVFSFGNVPEDKRPGVSLYVDEFQNFTTPDFEKLYSQGRKFGLRMVVANQRQDQLDTQLQKAAMSARTTIVFRTCVDDSRKLAAIFPASAPRTKPEDINPYPCDYLISHTHLLTEPAVLQIVHHYLLPLQGGRSSRGQVTIEDADFHTEEFFGSAQGLLTGAALFSSMLSGPPDHKKPVRVPDPTPTLDMLLREAMAFNDPLLPIPPVVVQGLANSGNFFSAVRYISPDHPALQPGFTPPRDLVYVEAGGSFDVLRLPESPNEWLAHCAFLLRRTMAYLAGHPLGSAKETNVSEVAQKLTMLPKRIAFMRSGDDFGPIRTLDAPEPTADSASSLSLVLDQSRQRYCRPREDVEAAFNDTAWDSAPDMPDAGGQASPDYHARADVEPELRQELPPEPTVSRWEV